jgi:NAD(P)-dependent dehydrogenase (short-subunit alcohol dehydrogenase family)
MDKNLFITGTSKGLGYAVTREFVSRGWKVYCIIKDKKDIETMKNIDKDNVFPIVSDVTKDTVKKDIEKVLNKNIKIDLLINNAGEAEKPLPFLQSDIEGIKRNLDIHCIGAARVTQAVLDQMEENSSIINISSRFGSVKKIASGELDHIPCSYSYKIAKGAQTMFTQCLSRELKDTNIKVCSLHPGKLKTALAAPDADHEPEEAAAEIFKIKDKIENGKFYSLFEGEFEV